MKWWIIFISFILGMTFLRVMQNISENIDRKMVEEDYKKLKKGRAR